MVLAALVVSYASSLRAWADQRSRIAEMNAEVATREKRVADLEKELKRWDDPAFIEAQARERFRWVMPGEIGFVVVDADGRVSDGTQIERQKSNAAAKPPWWRLLWGSIEVAGKPPKTAAEQRAKAKKPKPAETIKPIDPDGD